MGVGGREDGESQCHNVRNCCWLNIRQKLGLSISCDNVNQSEDEIDLTHISAAVLVCGMMVGVMGLC